MTKTQPKPRRRALLAAFWTAYVVAMACAATFIATFVLRLVGVGGNLTTYLNAAAAAGAFAAIGAVFLIRAARNRILRTRPAKAALSTDDIDRATRRLWHTSQHDKCTIFLGGRIQEDVNVLRRTAGLPEFGWNDSVPDQEVGRCTVHSEDCAGQHTHGPGARP